MKQKGLFCLLLAALLAVLSACQADEPSALPIAESTSATEDVDSTAEETEAVVLYSFEPPTAFIYDGTRYDMTERNPSINALFGPTKVGKHLVIEGHVGPYNGVYSIFNTETRTFDKDLIGCNLIWKNDDITTAVYSFWEGIYTYDGEKIADIDLEPITEFIDELAFIGEDKLLVTVDGKEGGRTETILLPKAD